VAVCASTEVSRAGLEEVLARTGGLHDVITARTMADFVPRCGNEGPDVALLEVQAAGTSTRDAITDLSQMPPAVRLIGVCLRRQSARQAGEPRCLGMPKESSGRHGVPMLVQQLRVDHAVGRMEGDRLSLQSPSAPVPILEQAEPSALRPLQKGVAANGNAGPTATQIADRLGVTPKTSENHEHRIYFKLVCQSQSDPVSVAFHRGILDSDYAPVRQSRPDLPSSA
jgi:DNA-binding NarL/FixJ family response regulator